MQENSVLTQASTMSLQELRRIIEKTSVEEFETLKTKLAGDGRVGLAKLLAAHERRLAKEYQERLHTSTLYEEQERIAPLDLCLGLDEVGRGPLAGPLTVAGVVLPANPQIVGINDSKKLSAQQREKLAVRIKELALAWTLVDISAADIDALGIAQALRQAFLQALIQIEEDSSLKGRPPLTHILIDGRPLNLDAREISIVKGDGCIAAIAAASILAKDHRDKLMIALNEKYPQYYFDVHKGYGTQEHIRRIQEFGLSAEHRVSFCSKIQTS